MDDTETIIRDLMGIALPKKLDKLDRHELTEEFEMLVNRWPSARTDARRACDDLDAIAADVLLGTHGPDTDAACRSVIGLLEGQAYSANWAISQRTGAAPSPISASARTLAWRVALALRRARRRSALEECENVDRAYANAVVAAFRNRESRTVLFPALIRDGDVPILVELHAREDAAHRRGSPTRFEGLRATERGRIPEALLLGAPTTIFLHDVGTSCEHLKPIDGVSYTLPLCMALRAVRKRLALSSRLCFGGVLDKDGAAKVHVATRRVKSEESEEAEAGVIRSKLGACTAAGLCLIYATTVATDAPPEDLIPVRSINEAMRHATARRRAFVAGGIAAAAFGAVGAFAYLKHAEANRERLEAERQRAQAVAQTHQAADQVYARCGAPRYEAVEGLSCLSTIKAFLPSASAELSNVPWSLRAAALAASTSQPQVLHAITPANYRVSILDVDASAGVAVLLDRSGDSSVVPDEQWMFTRGSHNGSDAEPLLHDGFGDRVRAQAITTNASGGFEVMPLISEADWLQVDQLRVSGDRDFPVQFRRIRKGATANEAIVEMVASRSDAESVRRSVKVFWPTPHPDVDGSWNFDIDEANGEIWRYQHQWSQSLGGTEELQIFPASGVPVEILAPESGRIIAESPDKDLIVVRPAEHDAATKPLATVQTIHGVTVVTLRWGLIGADCAVGRGRAILCFKGSRSWLFAPEAGRELLEPEEAKWTMTFGQETLQLIPPVWVTSHVWRDHEGKNIFVTGILHDDNDPQFSVQEMLHLVVDPEGRVTALPSLTRINDGSALVHPNGVSSGKAISDGDDAWSLPTFESPTYIGPDLGLAKIGSSLATFALTRPNPLPVDGAAVAAANGHVVWVNTEHRNQPESGPAAVTVVGDGTPIPSSAAANWGVEPPSLPFVIDSSPDGRFALTWAPTLVSPSPASLLRPQETAVALLRYSDGRLLESASRIVPFPVDPRVFWRSHSVVYVGCGLSSDYKELGRCAVVSFDLSTGAALETPVDRSSEKEQPVVVVGNTIYGVSVSESGAEVAPIAWDLETGKKVAARLDGAGACTFETKDDVWTVRVHGLVHASSPSNDAALFGAATCGWLALVDGRVQSIVVPDSLTGTLSPGGELVLGSGKGEPRDCIYARLEGERLAFGQPACLGRNGWDGERLSHSWVFDGARATEFVWERGRGIGALSTELPLETFEGLSEWISERLPESGWRSPKTTWSVIARAVER